MTPDERIAALEKTVAALAQSNVATAKAVSTLNLALEGAVRVNGDLLALIMAAQQNQATMMTTTALVLDSSGHVPVAKFVEHLQIVRDSPATAGLSKSFLTLIIDALKIFEMTGKAPKLTIIEGGLDSDGAEETG
jgi:hypothetical protein